MNKSILLGLLFVAGAVQADPLFVARWNVIPADGPDIEYTLFIDNQNPPLKVQGVGRYPITDGVMEHKFLFSSTGLPTTSTLVCGTVTAYSIQFNKESAKAHPVCIQADFSIPDVPTNFQMTAQ